MATSLLQYKNCRIVRKLSIFVFSKCKWFKEMQVTEIESKKVVQDELLLGDSLLVLKDLESQSIDLIIT